MPGIFAALKVTQDRLDELKQALQLLAEREVLVGFPEENADRTPVEGEDSSITNASLAYIHDNGAPEQNIPARPFMIPGITAALPLVSAETGKMAQRVVASTSKGAAKKAVDQGYARVGLKAMTALKKKINEGVPPPLAESTLRRRANRGGKGYGARKGAKLELELRAAGWDPSVDFAKPLIDTGQLRNAISYVIRKRAARTGKKAA